jgi:Metallo-beta-lactamase superfamily
VFSIELLPARHGDALWIEYGDPDAPRCVLIDGGPRSKVTADALRERLNHRVADGGGDLELVVVTHIDADHITGILELLEDAEVDLDPGDFWFNGWDQLPTDLLGAKQGEDLSASILRRGLPWNEAFGGAGVAVPGDGPLPAVTLPGGLTLTLLSPGRRQLAELRPFWEEEVRKAGLVAGYGVEAPEAAPDVLGEARLDPEELSVEEFQEDDSAANGASIAMVAEFDGRSALLTGDAHAGVLVDGLKRFCAERHTPAVRVDAFKVPHHGSKYNLSGELLELLDCDRFLFSSNGRVFHHPDAVAVSRVVVGVDDCSLEFNYRSEFSERWDSSRLRRRFSYATVYPADGDEGLVVAL